MASSDPCWEKTEYLGIDKDKRGKKYKVMDGSNFIGVYDSMKQAKNAHPCLGPADKKRRFSQEDVLDRLDFYSRHFVEK